MAASVARIYRYPVKGLSAQALDQVALVPGEGLPWDRTFAVAYGSTTIDPVRPEWLPKSQFLTLMKHERLAALATRFDEATGQLTVLRHGRQVAAGRITEPLGRKLVEQFMAAYLGDESHGSPKLVAAAGTPFWDVDLPLLSIINDSSVTDLERVVGRPVEPLRFRGNLYLGDAAPWVEFDWVGQTIGIGDVRLEIIDRIERCAATNVDPASAERDMQIPKALAAGFGHVDMGVYARVIEGGTVRPGDALALG
jgi:uncharacterized protein YcbX